MGLLYNRQIVTRLPEYEGHRFKFMGPWKRSKDRQYWWRMTMAGEIIQFWPAKNLLRIL
jgi:hypothetical protein